MASPQKKLFYGALAAAGAFFVYKWMQRQSETPQDRFNAVQRDYILSEKTMAQIRRDFLNEMLEGLSRRKSSLKMLSSCVYKLPNGKETGIYYSLDWGGTNYRVLRCEFQGDGGEPLVRETKVQITEEFQKVSDPERLFDYLAQVLKEHMEECKEDDSKVDFPVGFTFSFPMTQPALDQGILIQWTKGFDIPGVAGRNVAKFMHSSFKKLDVPARIDAVCNDTVGTLLACAYQEPNTRVGLILGTGSNAAYVEPSRGGEVINIEWGDFDRVPVTPVDRLIDTYTPNPNQQRNEKMISGYYIGEIVRVLSITIFRKQITCSGGRFLKKWEFTSEMVSNVLADESANLAKVDEILLQYGIINFSREDRVLFRNICQLIVNRSADLAATCLSVVINRTGMKEVVVGIDGSVFKKMTRYEDRLRKTLGELLGIGNAESVKLEQASDGSGKGAALCVAASLGKRPSLSTMNLKGLQEALR